MTALAQHGEISTYSSGKKTPWASQDILTGYPGIVFVDWDNPVY